jgi:putative transposase
MGRPVRNVTAGGTYHVTARGNNGRRIFVTDDERMRFLGTVAEVVGKRSWTNLAYCLMSNHIHLILRTQEADLSDGMRDILARHAKAFNREHGRTGHLFCERFYSVDVASEAHLFAALRYVARNPVKAGLVQSAHLWRWGSYRAVVLKQAPSAGHDREWVLDQFHHDRAQAVGLLREFVEGDEGDASAPLVDAPTVARPSTLAMVMDVNAAIAASVDRGYSLRQIADDLGMSRSSVAHRLRRNRRS